MDTRFGLPGLIAVTNLVSSKRFLVFTRGKSGHFATERVYFSVGEFQVFAGEVVLALVDRLPMMC